MTELTRRIGGAELEVIVSDIMTLGVDAIVNAANSSLLGGGGVGGISRDFDRHFPLSDGSGRDDCDPYDH